MLASTLLINHSWRTKPMASKFAHTRVLVVDNDPALRELIVECLRKLGVHYYFTATNSTEAMRFLCDSSHNFQVVFTGKDMPSTDDGLDLLIQMREYMHLSHIQVAMVTGALSPNNQSWGTAELNLRAFLNKKGVFAIPKNSLDTSVVREALRELAVH